MFTPDVARLIQELRDKDAAVRRNAAVALGELGPLAAGAVPALAKALRGNDPHLRHDAAIALGRIGPAALPAIPALIELKRDETFIVRKASAHALGSLGPLTADVVPALIGALRDETSTVKHAAVEALGKIGPVTEDVIPALMRLLFSETYCRIVDLPGVTGNIYDDRIPAISTSFPVEFQYVADALNQSGQPPVSELVAFIRRETSPMRLLAAKVLSRLGDRGLIELMKLRDDPDQSLSRSAKEALVGCGLPPEVIVASLSRDTPWDADAGKLLEDLKVFYLVGCAYRAGHCSLRAANRYLADIMLAHSGTDDLAVTNVSFRKKIAKLTPLSCKVLGNDGVTLLIMSKNESQHLPARFSEDGWKIWEWSEAFSRRHLGNDWWGLSLASHDA